MLFTASYLLNGLPNENQQASIYPWVHAMCNNLSHSHALREVLVPDESSIAILDKSSPEQKAARDMSMCAGEFMIAYGESKEEV